MSLKVLLCRQICPPSSCQPSFSDIVAAKTEAFMIPNGLPPLKIQSESRSQIKDANKCFDVDLIHQFDMRMFVRLFEEIQKSF